MKWNEAEVRDLICLRHEGRTWAEVALALNGRYGNARSADACSGKYYHLRLSGGLYALTMRGTHDEPTYDDLAREWGRWIGRAPKDVVPPSLDEGDSRYIGLICDTHCPYENRDVIKGLADDGPYDIIVHAGDLLDYESVSTFIHERGCSMKEEIQHGTWVLEVLAGAAKQVIVTTDNHGKRILKSLQKANLPPELMEILGWLAPNLDLFNIMAGDLDNVTISDTDTVAEDGSVLMLSFLAQVGDLVAGHPDASSKIPLRSVHRFDEWLSLWRDTLGLRPWRVIAMGHTHQLGASYERGGHKLYLELGSAITTGGMAYALKGKTGYRPPVPAYTTLRQHRGENGNWYTDFNSVRQIIVRR